MKKQVGATLVSIFFLTALAGQVLAVGQERVQDPLSHEEETFAPGDSGDQDRDMMQDGTGTGSAQISGQGLKGVSQNLNRESSRINNPEVGEQIRVMAEKHEQLQTKTQTALKKIEGRPGFLKFLIGPDYKNAGQLRSDVVSIRNDIKQLENLSGNMDSQDSADIESAIAELQKEADSLESQLTKQLSGFSLFGWLGKIISNY